MMPRNAVQSLRQLVTKNNDVSRLNMGVDPLVNMTSLFIKQRSDAETVRMSARKYAPPQLNFMSDTIREL
jgi:hypothetical protein